MNSITRCKAFYIFAITLFSILPFTAERNSWTQPGDVHRSLLLSQLSDRDANEEEDFGNFNTLSQIAATDPAHSNEAIRILIDALNDPSPEIRRSAAIALRNIGSGAEAAIPALARALQDPNTDVRRSAILALRSIDATPAINDIILALNDTDNIVRASAAEALRSTGAQAQNALPKMIEMLQSDPDGDVRSSVAVAIALINEDIRSSADPTSPEIVSSNRTIVRALNQALNDPSWLVRRASAEGINSMAQGGVAVQETIPNLRKVLHDQNGTLRTYAALALGSIGADANAAVPDLKQLLTNDENPYVRGIAASALGRILASQDKLDVEDQAAIEQLINALENHESIVRRNALAALNELAESLEGKVEEKGIELDLAIAYVQQSAAKLRDPELGYEEADIRKWELYLRRLTNRRIEYEIVNATIKNPWVWIFGAYFISHLGLFLLRPLWLLKIDQMLKPLGFVITPIGMEISPRHLIIGKYHPRVLDAWVAAHFKSVQEEFQQKDTVHNREIYIPTSVVLNGRTIAQLTSKDLRTTFKKHLLIWGEGGSGKTSLACQIARWAMSDDPTERLYEHQVLPILVEEDLEHNSEAEEEPLFAAIRGQLEDLTDESESISVELLEHLLRKRRILVIIDHLSEMSEETHQLIRPDLPDFPINALIVTSRSEEKLGHVTKAIIRPLRIEGNRLSSFMEAYLMQRGKRDLFTDAEFFTACSRLSLMVGQRNITPLLAKLYAEQLITAKIGVIQDNPLQLPDNIPDLMLSYLNELNRHVQEEDKLDDRTIHHDAKAVAWECLKQNYRPISAKREDALNAIGGEDAEKRLLYLEKRLHLIQTISPSEDQVRFALDPLAEYLAALNLVESHKNDKEFWLAFLEQLGSKLATPNGMTGFLMALQDCCLAKEKDLNVPDFLIEHLNGLQSKEDREPNFLVNTISRTVSTIQSEKS
ncbi:HEAT repeat domain-containing protein [Egbenema bharatensis]|uniref:HEAT repeat domain-containing protein n=1 Tax=Egbenema bharatensis TaxID=3463334 RepID=UPI003A89D939